MMATNQSAAAERTPSIGAEALGNLESLPLYRPAARFAGTDSHDATGGNNDGFEGTYSYLYRDGDEWVLFEEEGPGCVYVVRTIGHQGNFNVYLDGAEEPVIALPFEKMYAGDTPPFVSPFVGAEERDHGSSWSYVPIPFSKSCRITTDEMGKPHFYNIFAHKYPPETEVNSYKGNPNLTSAAQWWSAPATFPYERTVVDTSGRITIAPLQRAAIFEEAGGGAVISLRVRVQDVLDAADLRLKAWWDGQLEAAVDSPVSSFFGIGCPRAVRASFHADPAEQDTERYLGGRIPPRGIYAGQGEDGWLYCHFPMPYWKSAHIELLNESGRENVEVAYEITCTEQAYPAEACYFHAKWRQEAPVREGVDYCVLDTRGHGHYVGCVLTMSTAHHDSPYIESRVRGHLEGDARFYSDDNRTPVVASTGTEEYFNWGWYDVRAHDSLFAYPTHGYPLHVGARQDHSVMYRFHVGEVVPFHRSFRFDLEHGAIGREGGVYSGTAFYYLRPEVRLTLTDEVDVVDKASEKAHGYKRRGVVAEKTWTLPYEGEDQLALTRDAPNDRPGAVTDTGRAWSKSCSFKASIDPENQGVLLRRRSYYGFEADGEIVANPPDPVLIPKQRVRVEVDGEMAGEWYVPAGHARETWRDTEFHIAKALTQGKDTVEIRLTALDGTHWDEYTYWVYSYLH